MSVTANVGAMFLFGAERTSPEQILAVHTTSHGSRELSWQAAGRAVREIALGLLAHGLAPGARIPMASAREPELPLAGLALMSARACPVVLPAFAPSDALLRFARAHESPFLFVPDAVRAEELLARRDDWPPGAVLVVGDPEFRGPDAPVVTVEQLRERGRHSALDEELLRRSAEAQATDDAVVVFTRGESGDSRPIALDHATLLGATEALTSLQLVAPGERLLLGATMAEAPAWSLGLLTSLHHRAALRLVSGPLRRESLLALDPHVLLCGAEQLTHLLAETVRQLRHREGAGTDAAWIPGQDDLLAMHKAAPWLSRLLRREKSPAAARTHLAPSLRRVVVWGETVGDWSREACAAFDIELVELFTLSETGGAVACRRSARPGGFHPLPGVTLRDEGGRPCCQPSWMPSAAPASFQTHDERGLRPLYAGPPCLPDGAGGLFDPRPFERLLTVSPLLRRACVIQGRRDRLCVVVEPDREELRRWQLANGHFTKQMHEAVAEKTVELALLHRLLSRAHHALPTGCEVAELRVSLDDWSVEGGTLSPFGDPNREGIRARLQDFPVCAKPKPESPRRNPR